MSTKNTGGAAFPIPKDRDISDSHKNGMTIRDYFAAKAMAEIKWRDFPLEQCANKCYKIADAMLAEREK